MFNPRSRLFCWRCLGNTDDIVVRLLWHACGMPEANLAVVFSCTARGAPAESGPEVTRGSQAFGLCQDLTLPENTRQPFCFFRKVGP